MYYGHPLFWLMGFIFAVGFATLGFFALWAVLSTWNYIHAATRRTRTE